MRLVLYLLPAALAFAATLWVRPAHAQVELEEADPPDGATLELPGTIRLCFSQEISGQFVLAYRLPDGGEAGLTTSFDPNGRCLEIEPRLPAGATGGVHTLDWRVTSVAGDEQGSGTLSYNVGEEGVPLSLPSPTAVPTFPPGTPGAGPPGGTETPTETPTPTASPEETATATATPAGGEDKDDGGPDILMIALLTTAVAGAAAAVGTLGYLFRRKIGFDLHRPPEGGEEDRGHD